jgi:hypothetical protein
MNFALSYRIAATRACGAVIVNLSEPVLVLLDRLQDRTWGHLALQLGSAQNSRCVSFARDSEHFCSFVFVAPFYHFLAACLPPRGYRLLTMQHGSRLSTLLLVAANILLPVSIVVFATGFFPYKPLLPGLAEFEHLEFGPPPDAPFDRLIFMVVDALRRLSSALISKFNQLDARF